VAALDHEKPAKPIAVRFFQVHRWPLRNDLPRRSSLRVLTIVSRECKRNASNIAATEQ
jgi:hypothetical protein